MKDKNLFLFLSFLMGSVVVLSNYLVQFPFKFYDLEEVLTYGAFSYPIAFFITDLTNRKYGKQTARKVVYFGFFTGIILSIFLSFKNIDLISLRIAIASGTAFLSSQLLDIKIFDRLRKNKWFIPPLISSIVSSVVDTILFFSIAFYGTNMNWIMLAFGDLCVKIFMATLMLIPFRILMKYMQELKLSEKKFKKVF